MAEKTGIDYSKIDGQLLFPKVRKGGTGKKQPVAPAARPKPAARRKPAGPVKKRRAKKRRVAMAAAADDRGKVFARQGHVCFAVNVSPVCTRRVEDPHEVIPVGAGGERVSHNRVGLCRNCHDAAQGRVGGNRLKFRWKGAKPNADEPGNVSCYWDDGQKPLDSAGDPATLRRGRWAAGGDPPPDSTTA